jgi:hypothetical protein
VVSVSSTSTVSSALGRALEVQARHQPAQHAVVRVLLQLARPRFGFTAIGRMRFARCLGIRRRW